MIFILISNLSLLSAIFLLLICAGFVIFNCLYITKNKLLNLGASMILGPLGFLFLLSTGSHFLKGQSAIVFMFLLYILAAFLLFLKRGKNNFYGFFSLKFTPKNLLISGILMVYLGLIFLFAHRSFIGSDSDIYFAIATSFAKGNYPVVESWQPQFLTVYHQGIYLFEGALWSLTGKDIELVHYFSSVYFIWAIFLLLTGLAREKVRSIWCLLPGVFGIILVGGPIFLTKLSSLSIFLFSLHLQPGFTEFQSSNGAGVTNLSTLIYTNFYTFGLAILLLFIILLGNQLTKKFSLGIYLFLLTLIMLGLSVDETFFPVELVLFGASFFWQSLPLVLFKKLAYFTAAAVTFAVLFFTIQNPIRDSILMPSRELPRFKLLVENNWPFLRQFFYLPGEKTSWNGLNSGSTASGMAEGRVKYSAGSTIENDIGSWERLDIRFVLAGLILILILSPSRVGFLLFSSAFLSYLMSLYLVNTFWPPNGLRITNQAFQLGLITLGYMTVKLFTYERILKKLLALIIISLLLPQILVSHSKISTFPHRKWEANVADARNNFTKEKKDLDLENIAKLIPPGKVTVFLDRYPDPAPFSYLNYTALTKYGVFVPIAPPGVKILNPAPGIEWLDAVNSLSPYALKELKVEYAYIQNAALSRLSAGKIDALKDKKYFEQIKEFGEDGILYKVKPDYLSLQEELNSLKQMSLAIGKGKRVYLDKLKFSEVRKALILELAKTNNLIGYPPAHGGDFYMYIETLLPFEAENPENIKKLDFVITDQDKNPNNFLPGEFEKVLSNNYVSIWRSILNQ